MSTTTFLAAAAGKTILSKAITGICAVAGGEIKKRVLRWKTKAHIDKLYKNISSVRNVKTLLQIDKAIDLAKFYYPSKVEIDRQRLDAVDIDVFGTNRAIIEGTVGQGKSIFFRYLTARELQRGQAIPLFIELRKTSHYQSLVAHIIAEAACFGIDIDESMFRFFAENAKFVLFLDAFDEVPDSHQSRLVDDIEQLARQYEHLQIYISSRPDSSISPSALFRVFKLSPLRDNEYIHVISRLTAESNLEKEILARIKTVRAVAPLLSTPLMVTLLVVRYKIDQTIPHNTASFYQDLFELLLQRHDRFKAGYSRPRHSGVGDNDLKRIFSAFCYLLRRDHQELLRVDAAIAYLNRAIEHVRCTAVAEKVFDDIVKITCLLLREGGECRFVHRSVQEFHAALWISEQSDASAQLFYSKVRDKWHKWRVVLEFLRTIDVHRFNKYFVLPDLAELIGVDIGVPMEQWSVNTAPILKVYEKMSLCVSKNPDGRCKLSHISHSEILPWSLEEMSPFWVINLSQALNANADVAEHILNQESLPWQATTNGYLATIDGSHFVNRLAGVAQIPAETTATHLANTLKEMVAAVNDNDRNIHMFDLD